MPLPTTPPSTRVARKRKPSRSPRGTLSSVDDMDRARSDDEDGDGDGGGNVREATPDVTDDVKELHLARKPAKRRRFAVSEDDLAYDFGLDFRKWFGAALSRTPPGRTHRFKALLTSVYSRVAAAQPLGVRCPVTLLDNKTRGFLQLAHLLWRSTSMELLDVFDCLLGLKRGDFNPDSFTERSLVFVGLHQWLDKGRFAIVPSVEVLEAVNYAIRNNGLTPPHKVYSEEAKINVNLKPSDKKRNVAGFVNHEKIFGRHVPRPCRIIPLWGWSSEMCIFRKVDSTQVPGDYRIYKYPFTGEDELPVIILHNYPILIAWNAYLSLQMAESRKPKKKKGKRMVTAQTLAEHELELVTQIGDFIERFRPPAAFMRSPARDFGTRSKSARIASQLESSESDFVPSDGSAEALTQGLPRSLTSKLARVSPLTKGRQSRKAGSLSGAL